MNEVFWIIATIALLLVLIVVLLTSSAIIADYREKLRDARLEIRVLTLHDDEIRAMYPLAEGRMLMRQTDPRWTEIEEEGKPNE